MELKKEKSMLVCIIIAGIVFATLMLGVNISLHQQKQETASMITETVASVVGLLEER